MSKKVDDLARHEPKQDSLYGSIHDPKPDSNAELGERNWQEAREKLVGKPSEMNK